MERQRGTLVSTSHFTFFKNERFHYLPLGELLPSLFHSHAKLTS